MFWKGFALYFALVFTVLFLWGAISNFVQFVIHVKYNKPFMASNGFSLLVELNAACAFWVWFISLYWA